MARSTADESKADLRRRCLDARAGLTPQQLEANAGKLLAHLRQSGWLRTAARVATYVPVGSEPGGPALLEALLDAGLRVVLPVVIRHQALDWAEYDGALAPGPIGLREPAGARLGPAALGAVDLVLVPALAVDRRGVRLGKGAGYYDRSLTFARSGVRLLALLHDGELRSEPLPAETHDVPVTHAVTPSGGITELG